MNQKLKSSFYVWLGLILLLFTGYAFISTPEASYSKIEKEKIFKHSYWSSFWGTDYNPNDFSVITYELIKNGNQTNLTVTQEGFKDEQSREHSVGNWKGILDNIKNLLEK